MVRKGNKHMVHDCEVLHVTKLRYDVSDGKVRNKDGRM